MATSIPFGLKRNMSFVGKSITRFAKLKVRHKNFSCSAKAFSKPEDNNDRDPFPVFLDEKVQDLMARITGFDALKVAGPHKRQLQKPKYKLLTDEELKGEMASARKRLSKRLQIPPYMNPRKPNLTPLSVDPDLAHFDTSKYVFTDVTFGIRDRDRSVVLREIDGTLLVAPWDVKDRMNQIYNPREGKEYLMPQMFEEKHIERLISEKKYAYILDRACCQFEPDDPDFIRATHRVYKAVDVAGDYDDLRSTRHFGSLAFYLIWHKMADSLLLDMLNRDLSSDARDLVRLFSILHPDSPCATSLHELTSDSQTQAVVQVYIDTTATLKDELQLALQAMRDAEKSNKKGLKSS